MFKTTKDIAKILDVHKNTVNRFISTNLTQLEPYIKKGRYNATMLNDKGIELLKELMKLDSEQTNITQPESTQPEITEKEPDSNQLNLKLAEEKIKHLELMNNLLEKHLEDLKSENKNLQLDIRESQHRHDTIIMSFSQRFEEMQKRLPMPRKEPEKKPGIIKKFFNWLTAPEQDPTNWEAEDQRFG